MNIRCLDRGVLRKLAPISLCLVLVVSNAGSARAFAWWASGVSGLTSDATKWNPVGVPANGEGMGFGVSGTYVVTFTSTTPSSDGIIVGSGIQSFRMLADHTTGGLAVAQYAPSAALTLDRGTLYADYLSLGDINGFSTMKISEDPATKTTGILRSKGSGNTAPTGIGDQIGLGGLTELYIINGGRYFCDRDEPLSGAMTISTLAGSSTTVAISGSGGLPAHSSLLALTNGASLTVGGHGSGNVFVYNKGILTATGSVRLGFYPDGSGYLTVGEAGSVSNGTFNAQSTLFIGGNNAGGNDAGHGELTVREKGVVTVSDRCEVGDPDNDTSSLLRVQTGGSFTALNGLKFWSLSGAGMNLEGGLTQVQAGAFEWPAGKLLSISSTIGNPEFLIENGIDNVGPSAPVTQVQLIVGRDGEGTMTVSGPGTRFSMGPGSTSLGELAGGHGRLQLSDSAEWLSQGQMVVGNHGEGYWYLSNGAHANVDNMTLGTSVGGHGFVDVNGPGNELLVADRVWVGGGSGGAGGFGYLNIRNGGRVEVLDVAGGINPALTTLYADGHLQLGPISEFSTPGDISNAGDVVLWDSDLIAQSLTMTSSGKLRGYGTVTGRVNNGGRIDPGFDYNQMYTIPIDGPYQQYSLGHYIVDLDASDGPQSDELVVNGPATLAGTLDLRPEIGFVAVPGQAFRILSATTVQGSFDGVTWQGLPLNGQVNVVYLPQAVYVVIPGAPTGVDDPRPKSILFQAINSSSRPAFALELPEAATVRIRAYDMRGRAVATVFEGRLQATRHLFDLEGGGRRLASGVYFAAAEIESGGHKSLHRARVVVVH